MYAGQIFFVLHKYSREHKEFLWSISEVCCIVKKQTCARLKNESLF